ncbi:hypothetical protein GE061_000269 [Apolygus lucorum]|uniref:Uncharacterized protein n=1 Tax=Apolygus lucorum TaxID=248454 RepID=A0A6A4KLI3_APOLU|nr:hypothetical protein GE061_000269 [Apolygus lucorum]
MQSAGDNPFADVLRSTRVGRYGPPSSHAFGMKRPASTSEAVSSLKFLRSGVQPQACEIAHKKPTDRVPVGRVGSPSRIGDARHGETCVVTAVASTSVHTYSMECLSASNNNTSRHKLRVEVLKRATSTQKSAGLEASAPRSDGYVALALRGVGQEVANFTSAPFEPPPDYAVSDDEFLGWESQNLSDVNLSDDETRPHDFLLPPHEALESGESSRQVEVDEHEKGLLLRALASASGL